MTRKKRKYFWFGVLIIIAIITIFFFLNSKTEFNQTSSVEYAQNIPLLDYSCQGIFPKNLTIINAVWAGGWDSTSNKFTNGLSLKLNCKRETSEGGNVNLYHCTSGFIVSQYALPDGTIINKNYFVSYSIILDKRDCLGNICRPTSISCNSKKYNPGFVNEGFYFSDIILSIDSLNCNGCLGSDGECYQIGSTYMGKICTE